MKPIVFLTGLRGAAKIKVLKALSQIDLPEQPVLVWEEAAATQGENLGASAVYRTVLRVREVYLENRPAVVAGIFPVSEVTGACERFAVDRYTIIDGTQPLDDLVREISVTLWTPRRLSCAALT